LENNNIGKHLSFDKNNNGIASSKAFFSINLLKKNEICGIGFCF
jgi:hypothetical protein